MLVSVKIYTVKYVATLFNSAKPETAQISSMVKWINCGKIHIIECYVGVKMNKARLYKMWMNLTDITLSKKARYQSLYILYDSI